MLYPLLRPLLFRLDPETTHAATLQLLRFAGAVPPLRSAVRRLFAVPKAQPVTVFGLSFTNRVGLAAGYDKDALAWRGLACLGFGHLEIGTVTPRPQPGNPRPRVFRLVEDRSLINRLGFPSHGAEFVAARLAGRRPASLVLGVNLGKQRDTPLESAVADYETLMDALASRADYLVVNVSSPNTPDLRRLAERGRLGPLLAALVQRRNALAREQGRALPLLVKLSPDLTEGELEEVLAEVEVATLDGVIATNTTVDRSNVRSALAREPGGLSGAALGPRSTAMVRRIHERTGGRLPIVASGGVLSADDARAKLDAGASLVQLYTGLIYVGPGLVRRVLATPGY